MAFGETADLVARLSLDDRAFVGGLRRADRALSGFSSNLGRAGKGFGQVGHGLARVGAIGATVAAGGLIGAAKAAIDFEDAFAGVEKTLDASPEEFAELERSIRDMATTIPVAATELAAIGETAGALGIHVDDVDEFISVVAKLGVTTDLSSDQAAEALGKVGTILGLTGQEFEDFADTLVNLGNQGASTESEIIEVAKRFAAMGKQAGLTTDQILALSSAATSLGAEPEAAGGALSRIFANMATEIALATDKGKAFADITGDSLDELQRRVDKGDALNILLETLEGISDLSRTEAASVLKALGITNVRDRDAILKMAQNTEFLNEQLDIAEDSTGALGREAGKRFDTIASKLTILKNGFIDAAITVGEGFLPALGRAADKLTAFLKVGENRAELQGLGKDVGKFIDSIDWDEVIDGGRTLIGVIKDASTVAISLLGVVSKLPKELLAAGAAALALNKLSGGLLAGGIGNIAGGLIAPIARNLGASLPGVGRAFVQPVFVTNMPAGGLGGGGGAGTVAGVGGAALAGIGGALGGALAVVTSTLAGEINKGLESTTIEARLDPSNQFTTAITGIEFGLEAIGQTLGGELKVEPPPPPPVPPVLQDIAFRQQRLGEITGGGFDEQHRIGTVTNQRLEDNRAAMNAGNALVNLNLARVGESVVSGTDRTYAGLEANRLAVAGVADTVRAATDRTYQTLENNRLTMATGLANTATAARGTTAAVNAKDLSVTVPVSVTAVTTVAGTRHQSRIYSSISKNQPV